MRRADRKKPSTCSPPSPRGVSTDYSAEQREQLRRGLHILARMIVRAHLRSEASRAADQRPAPPSDREAGG